MCGLGELEVSLELAKVDRFRGGDVFMSGCAPDLQALGSLLWSMQWLRWWGKGLSALFLPPRNVPNRYTFPCPYCAEKNFDQEGLVEHCKLTHSTDTKSVVRIGFSSLIR